MTALCRILLTIVPALWAGTALADTAFLSLDVGGERIDAQAGDVAGHARDADGTLFIRLRSSFDAPIARLTGRHPGAVATLTLCGEVLVVATLSAPLATSVFSVTDPARGDWAAARLGAQSCDLP